MKYINTNQIVDPNTEQPYLGPSLEFHQAGTKESINNVIFALTGKQALDTNVYVLWGCLNSTPGTATFTISAGAVSFNGETYLVDAFTLTPGGNTVVASVVITNPAPDPVQFSDLSSKNVHDVRKIALIVGASGSTIADYNNFIFLNDKWHNVGNTGEPAFGGGGWANAGAGNMPVRFRLSPQNTLLISGVVGTLGVSGTKIFTLPLTPFNLRPINAVAMACAADLNKAAYLSIQTNGDVNGFFEAGSTFMSFSMEIPLN